ncbi:Retrovirus-related Pol polyprotein from transposon TNT 1-94 [Eumeta japonica]|uniref:Retrovirus-related Pol polyprotein from transposon TNT 1-94 n=1 Tax=Eumeta variegata TaxID=151549 RepID=A0A4C1UTV5_EUMVA|nr:Retrovirus-related Pol polyprotein from transposon TNT 1-94 [Eumeta japonica]
MTSNYLANIPKLKGRENYEEWCFAVQNVLVLENMASAITQRLAASSTETQNSDDAKAKAKLVLTIDPSLYVHIKYAATTYDLWEKLKNLFDDTSYTRKIGLLRKLINIRLENCDSMTQYVTQIVETSQRLQGTGFKISDEWIGALMLAGLPEKYGPMLMAIEHSGIEISADVIKTKLMDMCSEVGSVSVSCSETAFAANNRQRIKYNGNPKYDPKLTVTSKPVKVIKCYRCKQTGHYKNQCPTNSEISKRKQSNAFSAIFLSGKFNCDNWYIDSGASKHMTARKEYVVNPSYEHKTKEIIVANKTCVPVLCSGDVNIITVVNDVEYDITVSDVLCVPSLTTNLLSVSRLIENGNNVVFKEKCCYIYNQQGTLVGKAEQVDGVYRLYTKDVEQILAATAKTSSETWHRRLGHINSASMNKMKNGAAEGISYTDIANIDKYKCTVCCKGKQTRHSFQPSSSNTENVLDLVHSDVCGPMENVSIGGSRYYILFVDDHSKMAFIYFMKAKSEAFKYFKEFQSMVENQKNRKIKVFRTDNGGEYCNKDFDKYLKQQGIIHQRTNAYTPENGVCERMNRSLVEKARCLIFDASLHKKFWAEAMHTSVYLRNRSVVTGLNDMTPYEVWTGNKPNLSHVRIFGSKVMMHIPKEKRLKWDEKARELILVGYAENVKGYRVYDPENNSVTTSRDIIIMEKAENTVDIPIECKDSAEDQEHEEKEESSFNDTDIDDEKDITYVPDASSVSDTYDSSDTHSTASESDESVINVNQEVTDKRVRKIPDRFGYNHLCITEPEDHNVTDITLEEALNGPESKHWRESMEEELESFRKNDAWELVDKPHDSTVVQCKWVFKKKYDSVGEVRYRARLVAKGFAQKAGIDYHETFSPVLRYTTLRLLFSLSVKLNLDIRHLDVTTAFLNGYLNECLEPTRQLVNAILEARSDLTKIATTQIVTRFFEGRHGHVHVGFERFCHSPLGLMVGSNFFQKSAPVIVFDLPYERLHFALEGSRSRLGVEYAFARRRAAFLALINSRTSAGRARRYEIAGTFLCHCLTTNLMCLVRTPTAVSMSLLDVISFGITLRLEVSTSSSAVDTRFQSMIVFVLVGCSLPINEPSLSSTEGSLLPRFTSRSQLSSDLVSRLLISRDLVFLVCDLRWLGDVLWITSAEYSVAHFPNSNMLFSRPRALNGISEIAFGLWRPTKITAESTRLGKLRALDHSQHEHIGGNVLSEWTGTGYVCLAVTGLGGSRVPFLTGSVSTLGGVLLNHLLVTGVRPRN